MVVPRIGRTRLGHRTLKCALTIGTQSAQSIRASGTSAASTGRTRDRTRPMLQQRQKVLAKAPSTRDPRATSTNQNCCCTTYHLNPPVAALLVRQRDSFSRLTSLPLPLSAATGVSIVPPAWAGAGRPRCPQVGPGAASAQDQKERQFLFQPEAWQLVERQPLVETEPRPQ